MNYRVQTYTNYKAFLLSYSEDAKRQNKNWSLGVWARQLGLKDTSSITKILNGQRHPGDKLTKKLNEFFKFEHDESQYFADLVRLQKHGNDPKLCIAILERMEKLHPNAHLRIIDMSTFNLISHWYCLAIREMVRLERFKEDYEWISSKLNFKVTPKEVKKTINLLIELDLLERNSEGKLAINQHGRVHTNNDIASEAIKRYHEQTLENAKLAVRHFSTDEREFQASSFNMRRENMPKAKELIREFKSKFVKLLEEEKSDDVFQIQLQFYPITKISKANN
ncbi:MAG: TIGR02147 family protein [Bacteriovoracaceae bacterium]|nr:TIGR02147 family protein [Bacteriovoracaceae bacterium]